MPAFLEKKLKQEYGANSKVPYMVMNKIGAMRGNKETAKGAAMQAKHNRQEKAGTAEDEHVQRVKENKVESKYHR
jgi:hypothetical protein